MSDFPPPPPAEMFADEPPAPKPEIEDEEVDDAWGFPLEHDEQEHGTADDEAPPPPKPVPAARRSVNATMSAREARERVLADRPKPAPRPSPRPKPPTASKPT